MGKSLWTCGVVTCAVVLAAEGAALKPKCMDVLPLGQVRAEGWLLKQLEKQREGLTGHAEELYDDIGKSRWICDNPKGDGWERGPYYAKGLVALALTLDDAELRSRAKKWVDAILASQRADGDFAVGLSGDDDPAEPCVPISQQTEELNEK